MKFFFLLLLPLFLSAQSFMISNIPLPKTYVQDLDPYECDEICLQEFLDNGYIFSFLSHANSKLDNSTQNEARVMFVSIFNLGGASYSGENLKIALLLPYKRIGKYAASTTNAAFAYLMTKGHPFMLKSYKIESEESEDIAVALEEIQEDGFEYVIAPVTLKGANNIIQINRDRHIYFPTIHKNDINSSSPLFLFGAIDYKAQSDLLLEQAVSPLVIFSDKSNTGQKLSLAQKEAFLSMDEENIVINYSLSRKRTNLEAYLKENEKINDASFFINTPIIKSGMIMSQITLYDVNSTNILSTQINYNPLLLSMTQYSDRKNMLIANSITEHNKVLIETNSLLGNDIVYDWINYTTTVGVDYYYSQITEEDRVYSTQIIDNQMAYKIELLKPSHSKFILEKSLQ